MRNHPGAAVFYFIGYEIKTFREDAHSAQG